MNHIHTIYVKASIRYPGGFEAWIYRQNSYAFYHMKSLQVKRLLKVLGRYNARVFSALTDTLTVVYTIPKRVNKYNYLLVIQQNCGGMGWEDVSEYDSNTEQELHAHDYKEYSLLGYPTRTINRRELKETQ